MFVVELSRRIYDIKQVIGQFDRATLPFTQMVRYATTAPLMAYPKALFFEDLKLHINGKFPKKSWGDAVLNHGSFRSAFQTLYHLSKTALAACSL